MKIYLAGKIAKHDWRHDVVRDLRDAFTNSGVARFVRRWPIMRGAVLGKHDYAGPYFVACDHGCFHGPDSHGAGTQKASACDTSSEAVAGGKTPQLCSDAIDGADMFFAWVNDPTAYGTFLELGYALRRVPNVVLAHPPGAFDVGETDDYTGEPDGRGPLADLWFYPGFIRAAGGHVIEASNPELALRLALGVPKS